MQKLTMALVLGLLAAPWEGRASDLLELVVPRTSFNVCFRFKVPEPESNSFNLALREALHREGVSLIGVGYIDGKLAMRLLLNNPAAGKGDVDAFFASLLAKGRQLLQERPLPAVVGGFCPVSL